MWNSIHTPTYATICISAQSSFTFTSQAVAWWVDRKQVNRVLSITRSANLEIRISHAPHYCCRRVRFNPRLVCDSDYVSNALSPKSKLCWVPSNSACDIHQTVTVTWYVTAGQRSPGLSRGGIMGRFCFMGFLIDRYWRFSRIGVSADFHAVLLSIQPSPSRMSRTVSDFVYMKPLYRNQCTYSTWDLSSRRCILLAVWTSSRGTPPFCCGSIQYYWQRYMRRDKILKRNSNQMV
jgi:hypothetical protein